LASALTIFDDRSQFAPSSSNRQPNNAILFLLPLGRRSTAGWCGSQSPQNVRCFSPHCLHVYDTRTCPWAAETRFSAPHFAHLLSIRVLPRLIAMALCSIASFTKRSVSSRIACFDISLSLAFCKIGHRAGRRPRQRRCCYRATPSRKVVNASRPIKKPGRVVRGTAFTDSSRGSPLACPSAGRPDRHASGKSPAPPARDALDVEIGHLRVSAFDERLVFLRGCVESATSL
jgi:hypothetical protein